MSALQLFLCQNQAVALFICTFNILFFLCSSHLVLYVQKCLLCDVQIICRCVCSVEAVLHTALPICQHCNYYPSQITTDLANNPTNFQAQYFHRIQYFALCNAIKYTLVACRRPGLIEMLLYNQVQQTQLSIAPAPQQKLIQFLQIFSRDGALAIFFAYNYTLSTFLWQNCIKYYLFFRLIPASNIVAMKKFWQSSPMIR